MVLRQLVAKVRADARRGRDFDAIFVTGDIVSHGSFGGYGEATRLLDDLCEATTLERERVFVVPGNHDIERNRGFFKRTLNDRTQSDIYFDPKRTQHHFERLEKYKAWYDQYFAGIRSFPTHTTCESVEPLVIHGHKIAVLLINTALFCEDDHDHEKLWIGRRCLDAALSELGAVDADVRFSLQHHPFDFLHSEERSLIEGKLQGGVDIILRGHLHVHSAQSVCNANSSAIHIAAGAAYQNTNHRKLVYYGRLEDAAAHVLPLRYFDDVEQWHSDPTLFPSAENNEGRFLLQRLGSRISRSTRPSPPNATARRPRANATTHTARELADWTAAAARDDDDALDSLTQITGLSLNWVHRRLNNADGRVRLRNAFARRWPNDEDTEAEGVAVTHGYTADTLASMTVASARDNRYVIRALARITHITETGVRKRLGSADGRARLGTLFEHFWPE